MQRTCVSERDVEWNTDVAVREQIVEDAKDIPQERIVEQIGEQIVDVPVRQFQELTEDVKIEVELVILLVPFPWGLSVLVLDANCHQAPPFPCHSSPLLAALNVLP